MNALVFDTETTGKRDPGLVEAAWIPIPSPGKIKQLAGELVGDACARDTMVQRFNPGKPIEFGAMATHHITNQAVEHCPPASTFRLPAGLTHLIGHKIDYDIDVITRRRRRRDTVRSGASVPWSWPNDSGPSATAIHSQRCSIFPMPEVAPVLAMHAHDAAVDVGINLRLLNLIVHELQWRGALRPDSEWCFADLWEISEIARIPEFMPFGKHKGRPIADVPRDYWGWYFEQADIDPYVVRAYREGGQPWPWPRPDAGHPAPQASVSVSKPEPVTAPQSAQSNTAPRFSFSPRPRA